MVSALVANAPESVNEFPSQETASAPALATACFEIFNTNISVTFTQGLPDSAASVKCTKPVVISSADGI